MKYNFDEPVDRSQNRSAKYDERVKNFGTDDVIPLWIADMDFKTAQPIIDACKKKAEEGIWGYTSRPDSYFKAYADWQERRNGWKFDPSLCSWSLGVVPALAGIIKLFTQKGEKVLIQPPVYPEFFDITENTGRTLVQNNFLERDGVWEVDFEDFERQAKDPEVKLFILCNPHNPTGRVWTDEELSGVTAFCKRHNLLLLSDDIHGDFVWPGHVYKPLLTMYHNPEQEKVIVFNSLTKTLNIPGLIFSSVILPNPEMRRAMEETIDRWGLHNPNVFAADILKPAYRECGEWVDRMRAQVYENIKTAQEFINRELPWLDAYVPDGTYLMWIGYGRTGLSEEDMRRLLEEKGHLIPLMGTHFKEAGRGWFRLNMGTSGEQVNKILERLALCWT